MVSGTAVVDAAQSDIAFLEAENIDWEAGVISFARKKTARLPSCGSMKKPPPCCAHCPPSARCFRNGLASPPPIGASVTSENPSGKQLEKNRNWPKITHKFCYRPIFYSYRSLELYLAV